LTKEDEAAQRRAMHEYNKKNFGPGGHKGRV